MDFATLKLGADTSALKQAEKVLDDVAATATSTAAKVDGAADKMDSSFDQVGSSAKGAASGVSAFEKAVKDAGSRIPVANDNIQGMGNTSKLASHHVQNLAFQTQDVVQQLIAGQSPMMIFMQQGGQIAGIMSAAGLSIGGVVKEMGLMIARAAAMVAFHPVTLIIAGVAAAVGVMTSEINENSKVTVTWTDTLLGAFDALKAGLSYGIDQAFKAFGTTTTEVWGGVVTAARTAINFVIGAVVAVPKAIYDAWTPIVYNVDVIFTNAMNAAISRINGVLTFFGQEALPTMKVTAVNSGVGIGDALGNSIKDSMTRNWLGDGAAALSPYAQERARKRLEDDAKEAGKKAGEKAGEGTIESLTDYIDKNTAKALAGLGKDFKFDDSAMKAAGGQLEAMVKGTGDVFKTTMEGNLKAFSDTFRDFGDLFGQRVGNSIDKMAGLMRDMFPSFANDLGSLFKDIGKSIDNVLAGLGTSLGQIGKSLGFGATVGGMVGNSKGNQIGGAIGAVAGEAIGKKIGGLGGPIGMIAGSILGSVLGGLFKGKNPYADVRLAATGSGTVFAERGGAESIQGGQALGSAFSQELGLIAQALGGTVRQNANFGSIGFSGEQFYFNASGGDFKGAGAQRFATAEEALTAAIRNAVNQGALEGLSESAKNVLASVTEINADTVARAMDRLNVARGKLVDAYNREAGALAQTIDRFKGFTAGLKSFRDQLAGETMSPEQMFLAAQRQFAEVSALAAAGNEGAIGDLVSVSQRYIDAARDFLTPEQYNREVANVIKAVDLAIAQSQSMEQLAQGQLDALNKSVEGLLKVDESVISVRQAIDDLRAVMGPVPASGSDTSSFMGAASSADEATRQELIIQNEYLRELVRLNAKQERTLQEIQIQGEA